jgi:carboxyl-terminal processing protease
VAGVKPGWILLAANGRPPKEVLGVGKLADGQSVRCDFLDAEGKPACLDIRARRMSYPPVRDAHRLPGSVLLLSFDTFDMPTARWLRRELKRQPPAAGLILDLRENSGGEARALAAIVAEIFPNPICIGKTRTRSRSHPEQHRSPRHSLAARYEGPLALIVSDATASAAEILAAVVQHEQRGTVVGMRTSGNVLVCVRWPMPDGGRLQLSVYDFIGPDGCRLEGKGVAPDIEVRPATGSPLDPQVEAALAALKRAAQ